MKIVALAGGVGGAKLAEGLSHLLPASDLTIIVNTGDDFEHLGLYISPDLDTVCYTLAGLADPIKGWGRKNESWNFLDNLTTLGGPTWFQIGDKDLATHIERTRRLNNSESLSQITNSFCRSWKIGAKIIPMSDSPVRTIVKSNEGSLPFQEYFVARRCEPKVSGFDFDGIEDAEPAPGVLSAINHADLIVICPSNPWVSIDPILKLKGFWEALDGKKVVAVSPIIQGNTIKGPAAKMYQELGIIPSALAVFKHYADILSAFVMDDLDSDLAENISVPVLVTDTIMKNKQDRTNLAKKVVEFCSFL
jgi:LPPG:FO 2-phospho-L-lactate transferase